MSWRPRLRRGIARQRDSHLRCFTSPAVTQRDEAVSNRQLTFALSNLGRARRWAEAAARLLEAEKRGQLVPDAIASPNLAVNPAPPAEGAENWSLDGGWKPVRKSWAEQVRGRNRYYQGGETQGKIYNGTAWFV
ncbi:hypothetical protein AK812_SmicGene2814 [Symbiodinium microadriaticum]|uniref:Uncharacterized protein n=1 Tax=Symbiodinium microadriaticum TaxID=2951 RepID=A0A1Q9F0Q4_SYMMI|nr:hypothetical protein AK812_SmicGene2814 [Symbiodinium microadriaticum]